MFVIDILTKGGIVYGLYALWQWISENDYITKGWTWFQGTWIYPYLETAWNWIIDVAWPWVKETAIALYEWFLTTYLWLSIILPSWNWLLDIAWPWIRDTAIAVYDWTILKALEAWAWFQTTWLYDQIVKYGTIVWMSDFVQSVWKWV